MAAARFVRIKGVIAIALALILVLNLGRASPVWGAQGSEPNWELPSIVVEGSASELLAEDAVLPTVRGPIQASGGTGFIQKDLSKSLPLVIADHGSAGSNSSVRGLGRTSDETGVESLGVPLNLPQGGGFDLSMFPRFLWSEYRLQIGPTTSSFSPQGVSGTLALVPWTDAALAFQKERFQVTQLYSSENVRQVSAGASYGSQWAALAGYSDGDTRGPSASVSGRWKASDRFSGKCHLLMTHLDVRAPGSRAYPTPNARQVTARWIPVAQIDARISSEAWLKSSVFADFLDLDYRDPDFGFSSRDRMRQLGIENALLWKDWKLGLSARQADYRASGVGIPKEVLWNLQATRTLGSEEIVVEPTLQLIGQSGSSFPQGGIGIRRELKLDGFRKAAVFSRLGLSHRLPTLVDRYYSMPGVFQGNPELKAERTWTGILGLEWEGKQWEGSLEGYVQLRRDAQIASGVPSPFNSGTARVYALMQQASVQVSSRLRLSQGLTLSRSRLEWNEGGFPYLSDLMGVFGVRFGLGVGSFEKGLGEGEFPGVFEAHFRGSSSRSSPMGTQLGGHGILDLGIHGRLWSDVLDGIARLENVLDRSVELIEGYPMHGRTLSLSLIARF